MLDPVKVWILLRFGFFEGLDTVVWILLRFRYCESLDTVKVLTEALILKMLRHISYGWFKIQTKSAKI